MESDYNVRKMPKLQLQQVVDSRRRETHFLETGLTPIKGH